MQLCAQTVADAVYDAILECATHLRPDVLEAVKAAQQYESEGRPQRILGQIVENACIAEKDRVPICQDTGSGTVFFSC